MVKLDGAPFKALAAPDQILTYQSSGYGVRNVCDRIHVLYGEKGEMKIESTPGKGTRVFIRIPKKTEAKVL